MGGQYDGSAQHCISVDWPAAYTWSARQYRRGYDGPISWMGSLIYESRDASGLYYRRNRYYDSEKGRFTQEDPIGLAGGVNVYGFAAGDPIAYSDPFGLCGKGNEPPCPTFWGFVATGARYVTAHAEETLITTGTLLRASVYALPLLLSGDSCPSCEAEHLERVRRRGPRYHRLESSTQTPRDAQMQEQSGEIWGRAPYGSDIPTVQAYKGPLPLGARGVEFVTSAVESPGSAAHPTAARWRPGDPGVSLEGDYAKIKVLITRNTQIPQ